MAENQIRFLLQNDWPVAQKESDARIWGGIQQGGESKHFDLKRSLHGNHYEGENFTLSFDQETKCAHCTYDGETKTTMKFHAPQSAFSHLHKDKIMINSLAVNDAGVAVSCDSRQRFLLWETQSGEIRREFPAEHVAEIYCCRFFPSGAVLLTGGADMQMKIWNAATAECAATLQPGSGCPGAWGGHRSAIFALDFIDRGRNIVSASRDGSLRLWDVANQTVLHAFDASETTQNAMNCCCVMKDVFAESAAAELPECGTEGKCLLGGNAAGFVRAFDIRNKTLAFHVTALDQKCVNKITAADSQAFVLGTAAGVVQCCDLRNTQQSLWILKQRRLSVTSLQSFALEDLHFIVAGFGDGSCCLLNAADGVIVREFSGPNVEPITDVAVEHKTQKLFTACRDGIIRAYELHSMI